MERGLAALRREQAERVMPVVGAILDCWDGTPNDEKDSFRKQFAHMHELLQKLNAAVEGAMRA